MSICGFKCEKCTLLKRCGGCSLCEASICNSKCGKCSVTCPKKGISVVNFRKTFIHSNSLNRNENYNLPHHIPVIPDKINTKLNIKFMGIHGGNFLSVDGSKIRNIYNKNGFRKVLNLDDNVEGILQFYVKDRTLEGMWNNKENIIHKLKLQNVRCVLSPNFSVYEDAPRMDHIYNIQRSIIFYNEMIKAGVNAIPDISWYNIEDLDFWIKLINDSKVKTIAFSFQVVDIRLKASGIWKHYLAGFRYLMNNLEIGISVVIIGASSESKAREIRVATPNGIKLHFINQSAYIQSQRGMLSNGRIRDITTPKNILFKKNIQYFNDVYKELNESGGILCRKEEEIVLRQGVQEQEMQV